MGEDILALVSPQQLHRQITAGKGTVIDGSWYLPTMKRNPSAEYLAAHIPGAIFVDIDTISDPSTDLPHMMPGADELAASLAAFGVDLHGPITIYDGAGLFSAARIRWMLRTVGVQNVAILDGGLPAWQAAGLPVEAGPVTTTPAPIRSVALNGGAIVDLGEMREIVADGTAQILDARPAGRYEGRTAEPRPGVRSGHMPGARNLPLDAIVDDGRLKSADALRAVFMGAGVDLGQPIVTSCGSGVTAAVLLLALERLGVEGGRLYDGSWAEWGAVPDTPVSCE